MANFGKRSVLCCEVQFISPENSNYSMQLRNQFQKTVRNEQKMKLRNAQSRENEKGNTERPVGLKKKLCSIPVLETTNSTMASLKKKWKKDNKSKHSNYT